MVQSVRSVSGYEFWVEVVEDVVGAPGEPV